MDHHRHSTMVRNWRATAVKNWASTEVMSWKTGDCYVLRSPHEGYLVEVSFTVYPDHPEYVHVRSTNWRAEHEPHGIFEIGAARKFYKDLIGAGFVQIQQGH